MASFKMMTYPMNRKYPTSESSFRSAVGTAIPIDPTITEGSGNTSSGGYSWNNGNGGYFGGNGYSLFNRGSLSTSNTGFQYKGETSKNGLQMQKWFDVGIGGNRGDYNEISNYWDVSSWLRPCTGIWCVTNTYGMTTTRGCSGSILNMAIRYCDSSRKIRTFSCTKKMTGSSNLSYGQSHYHSTGPEVWGYQLSDSDRNEIEYGRQDYWLIGFRIQMQLWREAGGASTDTLRFGISALTPSFGNSGAGWYQDGKHLIVLEGSGFSDRYSNHKRPILAG